jgi:hypothetical protein
MSYRDGILTELEWAKIRYLAENSKELPDAKTAPGNFAKKLAELLKTRSLPDNVIEYAATNQPQPHLPC